LDILKAYRLNPPILQAHCQSRTSQRCNQSSVKELAKATQEKRNFKKCPTARQKTMNITATNRPTNHGRQGSTGGNSVYVAIAGVVVNRRSVLLRNFVLNGPESASNPLLHIHAKRCKRFYQNT